MEGSRGVLEEFVRHYARETHGWHEFSAESKVSLP
jgi:hypothetical protein